ncbi:hypothetical protein N7540_000608 [Penicillium herquei]|nr:hypothetical protein N7540_000608 [Penicillium herquei]
MKQTGPLLSLIASMESRHHYTQLAHVVFDFDLAIRPPKRSCAGPETTNWNAHVVPGLGGDTIERALEIIAL